jgi:hypothetical protein
MDLIIEIPDVKRKKEAQPIDPHLVETRFDHLMVFPKGREARTSCAATQTQL